MRYFKFLLSAIGMMASSLFIGGIAASFLGLPLIGTSVLIFGLSLLVPDIPGVLALKIKWGAGVVDGRGKLNGWVFSQNKGGSYARTKVTPTNPQTSFQMSNRASFGSLAQAWAGLTEAQRAAWRALAASRPYTDIFGDSKYISGLSYFVKLNQNLNTIGVSPIDNAPTLTGVPAVLGLSVGADSAVPEVILDWTSGNVPAGHTMVVRVASNINQGVAFVKNMPRIVTNLASATASGEDIVIAVVGRFGSLTAGKNIVAQAWLVNNTTGEAGLVSQSLIRPIA